MNGIRITITSPEGFQTDYSSAPPDTTPVTNPDTTAEIPLLADVECDGKLYSGDNIPPICNADIPDTTVPETIATVGVANNNLPATGSAETTGLGIIALATIGIGGVMEYLSRRRPKNRA